MYQYNNQPVICDVRDRVIEREVREGGRRVEGRVKREERGRQVRDIGM